MQDSSLFSLRGDLDGDKQQDAYTQRERFVGLKLSEKEFLFPIHAVHEIVMIPSITFVPGGPRFIDGVFNLRGRILPAVNLRQLMGLSRGKVQASARIIIVRVRDFYLGLLVDGITYVVSLLPNEVETRPLPPSTVGASLMTQVAKSGDRILGIFDLEQIISAIGMEKVSENEACEAK